MMKRLAQRLALILPLLASLALLQGAGHPAQAQDAYRIRSGDTLRIEVIEDSSLNRSVLVSPDGRITVPLAGSIRAAGRTVEQVQTQLATALEPQFASPPNVFVGLQQLAERKPAAPTAPAEPVTWGVYLLGEIQSPGVVQVKPGTTVLQLFAQAKGFTRFAATKRIQLRRTEADGREHIYTLNYDAILSGKSRNGTAVVAEGDVFVIPQRHLFE